MSKHRKAILAAIGVLAVIFIAACTPQMKTASEPTPTTEAQPVEVQVSPENQYRDYVDREVGVQPDARKGLPDLGYTICGAFETEGIRRTLEIVLEAGPEAGFDMDEMVAVTYGAAKYLCPEYYDDLQAEVSS